MPGVTIWSDRFSDSEVFDLAVIMPADIYDREYLITEGDNISVFISYKYVFCITWPEFSHSL